MKILLKTENLSYDAPSNEVFSKGKNLRILNNISFKLFENEILGIAGESGSGKTTLAKLLAGIIFSNTGKLTFDFNNEWSGIKTKPVQILFQNSSEIINPIRKVGDIIEEAIRIKFGEKVNSNEMAISSLRLVGLNEDFTERRGFELSGGEQQRVALARIISVEPEILILDEPFSAQDVESQLNFLKLIKKISDEKKITLIIVSHDLNILRSLCTRIMILSKGEIVEMDKTEKIFSAPKSEFTKQLIKATSLEISS
ncbi:MAG: ATP-binding cassette domain-containing protein [Ignavibacteriaceae bacterium]|nr:ATP-binding cassette domain-containing protein [Ignavibacteriaceae bacterium]